MAEHTPHYTRTPPISFATSAATTGGQVVEVTGNMTVAPTGASSQKVVGVAARDAGGTNQQNQTPVYRDGIHDLTASGAIAAGDKVVSAAAGAVSALAAAAGATAADINNARSIIGVALEAIANGAKGRVALCLA